MRKSPGLLLLCSILFLVFFFPRPGSGKSTSPKAVRIEKHADGITIPYPEGFLGVRFFSDSIVHVTFSKDPRFFKRETIDVVGQPDSSVHWSLKTEPTAWSLQGTRLTVSIDRSTGRIGFLDSAGLPVLMESNHQLEPCEVQDEKTFHLRQQWMGSPGESLYGLGERQLGILDIKGYDLDLWQHNTNAVVPFLVSSRGYGILWENTSFTRFGDLGDFSPIPATVLCDKTGHPGGLTAQTGPSGPLSQTAELAFQIDKKSKKAQDTTRSWEGFLQAPTSGDYQFKCRSNGGVKVWLAGQLIMDHWRQGWLTADEQAKVTLESGKKYLFRIEWDTEQGTDFHFSWKPPSAGQEQATSLWSEVGSGIDYYFVYGPGLGKVVAGYRALTGPAPLMPSWAFGLWQSRQRYEKAQDSLDAVDGFRKRRIPFDNIVQDWRYWTDDTWGSHRFDPARFPDPVGWLQALHNRHSHVMISVWPKFYPDTDNFEALEEKGFLYPPNLKENAKDWLGRVFTFYDAFNPGARALFWRQLDADLFQKGIDAWWLDASEPDLTSSPPQREEVTAHMNPTALGSGAKMLLGYPLLHSRGIYEGQRTTAPNQRVFILTRCGFAGQQRYSAAVWSGDITSTWSALTKQLSAGLGFSLSGVPYWTTDTGGYTMQGKFSKKNPKEEDEDEWRELNARWFEFSTFCPLLRVHGELRPREMWELGGGGSPAYQAELKFDRMRYRLFPYLYSTAWAVTHQGDMFMRPLVVDFPGDAQAREILNEYMFGPAFLVAPVTQYKARSRSLYLPSGASWYDFWTGQSIPSGTRNAAAPYDAMPLFIRAGSILPFGPELQYIGEKPQDPITLYVYGGADADFTLYEDDGLTYDYEKGDYSEIPLHWDDASQTLTLGDRKGFFKGMLEKRTFQVVRITPDKPVGFSFSLKPIQSIEYDGTKTTIEIKKP